jgi:hypothetical protein
MMKERTVLHRGMVVLAAVCAALLTTSGNGVAQTVTPQLDDLILGFYATNGPSLNLEVDLGNMSNFYDATPGTTFSLPGLSTLDLGNVYGTNWFTRTDLFWGAIATTGRSQGTADGHAPVGTLWATRADGKSAWNSGSVFAQEEASANIEEMIDQGAAGSLYGASSTSNSAEAAVINASQPGSYTKQDAKTPGESFGYFNPSIDNSAVIPPGGQVVSDLYELPPTNGTDVASKDLGYLVLNQNGLSFQAIPEPSAAMLVALGMAVSGMLVRRRRS